MQIKRLARNTLTGFMILAIVYVIFYNWLDIPFMYFIYTATSGTIIMPLSHLISLIFAPECWTLLAILTIGYAYYQYKKKQNRNGDKLLRFGLTLIVTSTIVTLLKILLGRYRPDMLMTQDLYGFHLLSFANALHSTPSGHATMAFCGFYCIARLLKKSWLTPLLLFAAVIICLTKLALADHYCSDILFGAYLGIICVLWMEVILNHVLAKWNFNGKTA